MEKNTYEKPTPVIRIADFPSRNEIIDYFKLFMQTHEFYNYTIKNFINEILFIIPNNDLACKFLLEFNQKISGNLLYEKCDCSLRYKSMPNSLSLPKIKLNKSKQFIPQFFTNKMRLVKNKLKLNSSCISQFDKSHWAEIKERAGVINYYEPYREKYTVENQERRENKKRWLNQKGFNNHIGKASYSKEKDSYIKNYVNITPSLPPLLHKFRDTQKKKWLSKIGFRLY